MYKKIYNSGVLELFFDNPEDALHIREIARQTKLHPNTVLRDIGLLVKEGLLIKRETRAVTEVRANRDSELFYRLKKLYNLRKLYLSEFVDFLYKEYAAPEVIVLFGSYSRGEDTKKSDVDIAIVTKKQLSLDLGKFRELLKRDIQLHEISLEKVSKNFKANLANGIVLKGYLNI